MDNPRNTLSHEMGNADWLTLLREHAVSAKDLPKHLKCDRDFMLRAIEIDANNILFASQDIKIDRNSVLSAIQNGAEFQRVAMPFNDDHEILLEAIRAAGFCPEQSPFVHASKRMRANVLLALEAIKRDEQVFESIDQSLRFDRNFIIRSMQHNAEVFQYLAKHLKSNEGFIIDLLASVHRIDVSFLGHAPSNILASREVIVSAMHRDPSAYRYADRSIKYDRTILSLRD